jgi:molybdopterin molybdotransferase
MISVEEALTRILSAIKVLGDEQKPLLDSLGQVLAEDVYSPFDVPQYDNSAMDGYAVRAESIKDAGIGKPKVLSVIGEVPAGRLPNVMVKPGTAVRIMTGGFVPEGADTVVPFEETDEETRKANADKKHEVAIHAMLTKGCNIRRRGEDIAKGELVLKKGKVIGPPDIGVLASLGISSLSVIRRPVVGILATGDELVDLNQSLPEGKIYNSNSYSLAAQTASYGGIPKLLGMARDDVEGFTRSVRSALDCDMLVTSGGVSLGDYDIVKQVLAAEGKIDFWTVRMKPGKPLAFGMLKSTDGKQIPHFGLPGNPVSSMVAFEVFGRPAIYKMMGKGDSNKSNIDAVMEDSIRNGDGRRIFARVIVTRKDGKYFAHTTGSQGSGILTSMSKANGLAIVPETTKEVKVGDSVEVMMLDWREFRD